MGVKIPDLVDIVMAFAFYAYQKTSDDSDDDVTDDEFEDQGRTRKTRTSSKPQKTVDDYDFEVMWDKVRVDTKKPEYDNKNFTEDPQAQILYNSSFENKGQLVQKHHFETSEQTTSVITTTLTKGFTRGTEGMIQLAVPLEVAKTTAQFGKEVVINEDGKQTLKTRTWNARTSITVPAKKKTMVELVVLEKRFTCSFTTKVQLHGKVRVNIRDRQTGKLLKVVENRINRILADAKAKDEEKRREREEEKKDAKTRKEDSKQEGKKDTEEEENKEDAETEGKNTEEEGKRDTKEEKKKEDQSLLNAYNEKTKSWEIEGKMDFLYGVEQKTRVWYKDLPKEEEDDDIMDVALTGQDGDEEVEEEEEEEEKEEEDVEEIPEDVADASDESGDDRKIQNLVEKFELPSSASKSPQRRYSGRRGSDINPLSPLPGIPSGKH